jgi:hypothetical protein
MEGGGWIILNEIERHLAHQPITATRRRKPLRPNPLAKKDTVYVIAVGEKVRNCVFIAGVEVKL